MNGKQQRVLQQSQSAPEADETIVVSLDPESGISDQLRRRLLLRRFWQGAKGFWGAAGGRRSWLLSGAILLLILLNLAASYGMNIWNRAIFDALEKRDASTVFFVSMVYFPLLGASVCLVVAQVYARMTTQRRWREWLTHHLLDRWLVNGRYYQLHLVHGDHKNPEYRIADDIRLATDSPVDFATGVTTAVLSAATFIAVLWTIGGSLSFSVAGIEITIPGFLVIAAVAYAVLASGSMVFIGHRFVTVSENKNQSEAELRYVLILFGPGDLCSHVILVERRHFDFHAFCHCRSPLMSGAIPRDGGALVRASSSPQVNWRGHDDVNAERQSRFR